METDIPAALEELKEMLERLRELREWAKLAEQEMKPEVPPSFQLNRHVEEDSRNAYAAFVGKAFNARIALNNPTLTVTAAQKQEWQSTLDDLQNQVRLLYSTENFIRP